VKLDQLFVISQIQVSVEATSQSVFQVISQRLLQTSAKTSTIISPLSSNLVPIKAVQICTLSKGSSIHCTFLAISCIASHTVVFQVDISLFKVS